MAQELFKWVIPFFLVMIIGEAIYSHLTGKNLYRLKDTLSNLQCGISQFVTEVFFRVGFFALYHWIYTSWRIIDWPMAAFTLFMGVVLVDLMTYWAHRASHRVNLFWATHLVHHQSETFNFSTALRLSVLQRLLNFPLFFAPLAFLGLPTEAFVLGNVLVGINGFWNHTQIIGRLPILEWLIVTPSHHRVHHASNPRYIDRNYSNVFPIWDFVFGSYEKETEQPRFGITHEIECVTPWQANTSFFKVLKANADQKRGLIAKLGVYFGKPENLDYSVIVPVTKVVPSKRDHVVSGVLLGTSLLCLGVFMGLNRAIGENEFSIPSLFFAMATLLFAWASASRLSHQKQEEPFLQVSTLHPQKTGYTLHVVHTSQDRRLFLDVVRFIYKNDSKYIRPLDHDILSLFSESKNPHLSSGSFKLWLVKDQNGVPVGRIAAFLTQRMKKDSAPTGGFGFFESIDDFQVASLLISAATSFLRSLGAHKIEGPIQPGERDRFWGCRIEGLPDAGYAQNYNPDYYARLFKDQGFEIGYEQLFFGKDLTKKWPQRSVAVAERFRAKTGVRFVHFGELSGNQFAHACRAVYNVAWKSHPAFKEMSESECLAMFKKVKPIADPELMWLALDGDRPVGFMILIPEINPLFKSFGGRFGLLQKLEFLARRKLQPVNAITGLAFGVLPEFQGSGLPFALMDAAIRAHEKRPRYQLLVLNWIGDFNPRMIKFMAAIETQVIKKHATFIKPIMPVRMAGLRRPRLVTPKMAEAL